MVKNFGSLVTRNLSNPHSKATKRDGVSDRQDKDSNMTYDQGCRDIEKQIQYHFIYEGGV
jgi:hypothetical protein